MSAGTSIITFEPVAPFDFAKTLKFIGRFSPTSGEQRIDDGTLTKAFEIAGEAIVARIASTGDVEHPRLIAELSAKRAPRVDALSAVRERIAHYLSLDADLARFYATARRDPVMAPIVERGYGFHQVRFPTPFENAVWAILGQRAPQHVARRAKDRITDRFGVAREFEGNTYRAFPEARVLAGCSDDALADAVRNVRKASYVRAVTRAFAQVDDRWLRDAPYDAVRAWLLGIEGIGEWSAAFVLTRGIGRTDRVDPVRPMVEAAANAYGKPGLTTPGFAEIAARYGDDQGHWAFYLRAIREYETLE